MAGNWYNGYSPEERTAKGKDGKVRRAKGILPAFAPPCALCGDPDVAVEPHSEDYSLAYIWDPPAVYALCRHCHRHKLHMRFKDPIGWEVFKAHVRRGGYARELAKKDVVAELSHFRRARDRGGPAALKRLRERRLTGKEWWEHLSADPSTLTAKSARPRP